ncbi:MAG: hypothetical protein N4A47_03960 [Clostridia bacterium]|jgi:hypothetical protein|nr:hypothetical protein [Clostridia bacterium]
MKTNLKDMLDLELKAKTFDYKLDNSKIKKSKKEEKLKKHLKKQINKEMLCCLKS